MARNATGPLIVDIKRHSLEDGPGIRSVVFFKGCPLRCTFCQNPEAQEPGLEIAFFARKCIRCGRCADACPHGAIDLALPTRLLRDRCTRCGACADACPARALRRVGRHYSVEALEEILLRDLPFYRHSGGGVTLSGGEPTLYPHYVGALLRRLKSRDLHIVLETCGHFDRHAVRRDILPHLDLIYFDVKFPDPARHERHTGRSNHTILENLRWLLRQPHIDVHPRTPVIPGLTATHANLAAIADILSGLGAPTLELLPYNPMGIEKSRSLGRPTPPHPHSFMSTDEEAEVRAMFLEIIAHRFGRGVRS